MKETSKWKTESAHDLLNAGWKIREEGDYRTASGLLMQALFIFQELGDWWMMAECLNHIGIGFKNLYRQTQDKSFATLTEHFFQAAYEIMLSNGIDEQQKSFQASKLGEAALINQNYEKAIEWFQFTVDEAEDKTTGGYGDRKNHLGMAMFLLGAQTDDESLKSQAQLHVEEGLKIIEAVLNDNQELENIQQLNVWYVGGLLFGARMNYTDNYDQSQKLADQALLIAKKEDLPVRVVQAESLIKAIQDRNDQVILTTY